MLYDNLANGELSAYETSVRTKMAQGMSEEDAVRQASRELGVRVAEAAASGALMGFGFGAGGAAISANAETPSPGVRDGASIPTTPAAMFAEPTVEELTEAFINGAKRAGYVPPKVSTAPVNGQADAPLPTTDAVTKNTTAEPTVEELTAAFINGAKRAGYIPPKTSTESASGEPASTTIDTEQSPSTPLGVDEDGERAYTDKEQYEQYVSVLQELAPQSFEEFQNIRTTDPEQFKNLEDRYQTLSMYKMDSGSMKAKDIWELDQKTFKEKTEKFAERYGNRGNIAGAYLDGDFDKLYFAHSQINSEAGMLKGYNGSKRMVTLKNNRRFRCVDVYKANGDIRTDTFYDTEAKLFEYFADLYEQKPFTSITMLSERGMCDSCKGVMEQFKKQFPDVTINVVSNKRVEGNVWGWRRRK